VFAFKCPWAEDIKKEFGEAPMPFNLEWLKNMLGLRTEYPTKMYFVYNGWEWPWIDLDLSIYQILPSCNGLSKFDTKSLIRILFWITDSKIGSYKALVGEMVGTRQNLYIEHYSERRSCLKSPGFTLSAGTGP
jgi:hypothetical protein